jgi:hypothetical protein
MPLTLENKEIIDEKLAKLHSKLEQSTLLYGGITKQTLNARKTQHIDQRQPEGFFGKVSIKPTLNIKIGVRNEEAQLKQVKCAETYIMKRLVALYGDKCDNSRNKDGKLSNRGGAGMKKEPKITYRVYVMYE